MSNIRPVFNGIKNGMQVVADSAKRQKQVATRTAQLYHLSPKGTQSLKVKSWIRGVFRPIFKGMGNLSDDFKVLLNTIDKVGKNVKTSTAKALTENPNASVFRAKIEGLKASVPDVKSALQQVGGVNDVKAALEQKGKIAGMKEVGKAAFRVSACAGLSVIGTFLPVPGATVACWVTGEKLSNVLFGKPFLKNISKKLNK